MKERLLDKATKEYETRQRKFEALGWSLLVISLILIIIGLIKSKLFLALGVLLMALAIYFMIMGRMIHKTIRK